MMVGGSLAGLRDWEEDRWKMEDTDHVESFWSRVLKTSSSR